jgi:hypothetical protein
MQKIEPPQKDLWKIWKAGGGRQPIHKPLQANDLRQRRD